MAYATNTSVSVERSRNELEKILSKYGAKGFRYGWQEIDGQRIEAIEFDTSSRRVRFSLKLPVSTAKEFVYTPAGQQKRSAPQRQKAWEQACRSKWRALILCVKAKLEAVEAGISEFESEFMAWVVDPVSNRTVGELMMPQLADRYSGKAGFLRLPGLPGPTNP